MYVRRLALPTLPAVLALALLAGCGDSGSGSTTETSGTPAAAGTTAAEGTTAPDSTAPVPTTAGGGPPKTGDGKGGVKLTSVGQFDAPVYLTQPAEGGDLYVVQQGGAIRVVDDSGEIRPNPFLDVSDEIASGGEQGLLSMAFTPDYAKSGLFYVDYTDTNGDTHVVEYRRSSEDPLVADPSSARDVLTQDQPFSNHNGGLVLFGPDGKLYIGFGDGGSAGDPMRNGQNLDTFLGKILRIDPAQSGGKPYAVPTDNPFVGEGGAKPEIYEYGLRNPWRFSFDARTSDFLIGDVGQDEQEEVDFLPAARAAGANLGWSAFEGDASYNEDQASKAKEAIKPIAVLTHDDGNCSVTGGYVVRDPTLTSLYGRYLFGDFCKGDLVSLVPSGRSAEPVDLGLNVPGLSSFGEDADGHIYALSIEGDVYRLDAS